MEEYSLELDHDIYDELVYAVDTEREILDERIYYTDEMWEDGE